MGTVVALVFSIHVLGYINKNIEMNAKLWKVLINSFSGVVGACFSAVLSFLHEFNMLLHTKMLKHYIKSNQN